LRQPYDLRHTYATFGLRAGLSAFGRRLGDRVPGRLRALAGGRRPFDEAAVRELVRRDVVRAHNFAATQNHNLISDEEQSHEPVSSIIAPTLVIHGTADPMFPLEHGQALAEEIPGARLLPLEGGGHGIEQADWDTIARAILEHTTQTDAGPGDSCR